MKLKASSYVLACPTWQTQRQVFLTLGTPANDKVVTARHRGDFTDQYAENTLEAFHASYLACRPAIETDVRYTKDDQLVIFHDTHIGKMLEPGYDPRTNVGPNALLESLTLAELQAKKVLNVFTRQPARRENPQWPGVHTVEEMLRDYRYALSKRTELWSQLAQLRNGSRAQYDFGGTPPTSGDALQGRYLRAIAAGIKHDF